jgi:multidrug resistance efflux pump
MGTGRPPQRAVKRTNVHSPIAGIVKKIAVEAGSQPIKAGQLILQFENEELKLELEAAKIRLQDAQEELKTCADRTNFDCTPAERKDAEFKVAMAEIELRQCELRVSKTYVNSPADGTCTLGSNVALGAAITAGEVIGTVTTPAAAEQDARDGSSKPAASGQPASPTRPVGPGAPAATRRR